MKIIKTMMALAIVTITSTALAAGPGSTEYGTGAFAPGSNSTAIGNNVNCASSGDTNATCVGANTGASNNGTVVGANSTAGHNATTIGANAVADDNSAAFGTGSMGSSGGLAVGINASTGTANNAVALGNNTTATRDNEVAVGGRTIGQVGTATQADQATNLGQVQAIANQTLNSANQYTDTEISKIKITGGAPVAAVDYTNTTSSDLVLNSNGGAGTTISNVADGVQNHDAANMGQLRSVQSQLNGRIDGLQKRIDGVGAMAAAQSNIVYNPYGSRFQLGLGIGGMGQSQAIAVRAMIASQNRHYIWSVGASTATNGGTSFGAGMSISF
ncbi:hypothetical protein JAO10_08945 [Burkholderia contaminans]|uniref:hypothetical protein n=1 Tax=Burkholderia cepacia complex TaxID=87882 RepID=UPI0009B59447|nr:MULTISPECIES: hypothetical protein [Burkholderia cepacia complex]MBH9720457.1 hypothetical protein [Burkholderia contaminans]MCO8393851.1 hypothetical protein [Burkholderia cenocepacia]MCO8402207.1 hypothetical protein [Burkholderia cenocepacia]MCO8416378.1 hypothetical protein [Burkholderia cenocepacia]MCO8444814.1 hypothetical protein [Burkholderia cenocepacia]